MIGSDIFREITPILIYIYEYYTGALSLNFNSSFLTTNKTVSNFLPQQFL